MCILAAGHRAGLPLAAAQRRGRVVQAGHAETPPVPNKFLVAYKIIFTLGRRRQLFSKHYAITELISTQFNPDVLCSCRDNALSLSNSCQELEKRQKSYEHVTLFEYAPLNRLR